MIFKYYHIHFDSMNRFGCIELITYHNQNAAAQQFCYY